MVWKAVYIVFLSTLLSLVVRADSVVADNAPQTCKFEESIYHIQWDQEKDGLIVSSESSDIYLPNSFICTHSEKTDNVLSCPRILNKCRHKNDNNPHFSVMLHDTKNTVVPCAHQSNQNCRPNDSNWFYEYELNLAHTQESVCSNTEASTTTLKNNQTFDIIFRESVRKSLVKAMTRENSNEIKKRQKSKKLSLLFSYEPRSMKNQRLYFVNWSTNSTFLYGFTQGIFAYIIFTEKSGLNEEKTYIARFCKNDVSGFSYTDMALSCSNEFKNLTFSKASTAYVTKNTTVAETNLYVIFEKPDLNKNEQNSSISIICVFPLMENMFQPDEEISVKKLTTMAEFSGKATVLAVTTHENKAVAFVGTTGGNLLKFVLQTNTISVPRYNVSLRDFLIDNQPGPVIVKSVTFDIKEEKLYLLLNQTVVKVDVYSCSFYDHPRICYDSYLQCSWNRSTCISRNACTYPCKRTWKEYCEPARFALVSPKTGPLKGGTILKLNVTFGGADYVTDKNDQVSFSILNITCKQQNWTEYSNRSHYQWSVECITGAAGSECLGPAVMEVSDGWKITSRNHSAQNFTYLKPGLSDISPTYGPKAGGTNITLRGRNLNIGSNQKVSLSGVDCSISGNDGKTINCTTTAWPVNASKEMNYGIVKVWIDHEIVKPHSQDNNLTYKFKYKEDPKIDKIDNPKVTTYSGGKRIEVLGQNLNSTADPRIKVTVHYNESDVIIQQCEKCEHWGLKCPIPSIPPRETANLSVRATFSFIMDGVKQENLFRTSKDFYFDYYPDPELYPFNRTIQEADINPEMTVQGKYINSVLTSDDFEIFVNEASFCRMIYMTFSKIHCVPDQTAVERLKKRENQIYPIQAIAGQRSYQLGEILISKQEPENVYKFALIGVVSVVVSICVFLTIRLHLFACFHQKIKYEKGTNNDPIDVSVDQEILRVPSETSGQESTEEVPLTPPGNLTEPNISQELLEQLRMENLLVERKHITLEKVLGQGQFGVVFKGVLREPNEPQQIVAVKTMRTHNLPIRHQSDDLIREGIMMKDFHHLHVLKLLGVSFKSNGIPMVVLPYMENGDLLSYLQNANNDITMYRLVIFSIQIAEGMKYLASQKFIHRDLATRNCTLDRKMSVKIGDFGLSRDVYEKDYYRSNNTETPLPIRWMAPETLDLPREYTEKSDVWSFGVVLWELATRGEIPYGELHNREVMEKVPNGLRLPKPINCPTNLYVIMSSCWNNKKKKRPTFKELVIQLRNIEREVPNTELQRRIRLEYLVISVNEDTYV